MVLYVNITKDWKVTTYVLFVKISFFVTTDIQVYGRKYFPVVLLLEIKFNLEL